MLCTYSQAGFICVETPEPTAVQISLDVITGTCCIVPTDFQKLTLEQPLNAHIKTCHPREKKKCIIL